MEKELVGDRRWLTKEQMREAIAICHSLPGALAIQVGVYVSYLRAKLARLGAACSIRTITNVGYVLDVAPPEAAVVPEARRRSAR